MVTTATVTVEGAGSGKVAGKVWAGTMAIDNLVLLHFVVVPDAVLVCEVDKYFYTTWGDSVDGLHGRGWGHGDDDNISGAFNQAEGERR